MKPYSCPECSFEFNDPAIEEDKATSLVHCPRCNAKIEVFPVQEGNDVSTNFLQSILPPPLPRGVLDNPNWGPQKPDLNDDDRSKFEQDAENSSLGDNKNVNRLTPEDYDYWKPGPLVDSGEVASYPPELVIDDPNLDPAEIFVRKNKLRFIKLKWLLFGISGRIGRTSLFFSTIMMYGICFLLVELIDLILMKNPFLFFQHSTDVALFTEKDLENINLFIFAIFFIWCNWVLTLKRFHDFNSSFGTMLVVGLVSAIPFVGGFISLYYHFLKEGTQGPNQYGAGPGWINRSPKN